MNSNQVIGLMLFHSLLILCSSQFDFFYLVQQWPGSFCNTNNGCCYTQKPAANFSIHGLWPMRNSGFWSEYCPGSPFDKSKIRDLTGQLESQWPSLLCPATITSERFWQHEWTKHGTCSEHVLNFHNYFQKTLDLKMSINILKALQDKGISPNGTMYAISDIKDAIQSVNGGNKLSVECNKDKYGNIQLFEIRLCANATNFITCPGSVLLRNSCGSGKKIYFPMF